MAKRKKLLEVVDEGNRVARGICRRCGSPTLRPTLQWLRARREALGLSVDKLAERANLTRDHVRNAERGFIYPKAPHLAALGLRAEVPWPYRPTDDEVRAVEEIPLAEMVLAERAQTGSSS